MVVIPNNQRGLEPWPLTTWSLVKHSWRKEAESRATGIKKEFLVEEALLHPFQALHELPVDVIVHPRLGITSETAEVIADQIDAPQPTAALRDPME